MKSITFYQTHEAAEIFVEAPKPASKMLPDWYRAQEGVLGFGGTIKKCMPIFDILTSGYFLTMPCDIYVDSTNPDKLVYFIPPDGLDKLKEDMFDTHLAQQYSEYPKSEKYHKELLRIDPFYAVETKRGYSCMFIQPVHRGEPPLNLFPAVIDTDKYISHGHYSFQVEANFRGIVKQGTPIIQVIPFKRDDFISNVVSFEKGKEVLRRQAAKLKSTFSGGYKNKFRVIKKYK